MKVILTIYPVENKTLCERITVSSWSSLLAQLDNAYGNLRVDSVGLEVSCEYCDHVLQSIPFDLDRLRVALAGT